MKKRDWVLVLFALFFTWGIDQATKYYALYNISGIVDYGIFKFLIHRNPGAMLGTFSDLPPILRIVSLSTGGAFLVFIYGALQYLIPQRSIAIRVGMSLLMGGILGNVTDRILSGSIIDFIVIKTDFITSPAFNLADLIQWIGYGFIIFSLIKDGSQFWPEENARKRLWINPKFQLNYILFLCSTGLGFAIISGVFSYTFIHVTVDEFNKHAMEFQHTAKTSFTQPFLITFSIISISFMIILFIIGRRLSHRTAGPIYAFELFIKDLINGKQRSFKLRQGDDFLHLEETAKILSDHFKSLSPNNSSQDKEFDLREMITDSSLSDPDDKAS